MLGKEKNGVEMEKAGGGDSLAEDSGRALARFL